jgi:hypothetical protein
METRGLKVYRHNGRYLVLYNHWDSYPEGLGLEVLGEIPHAGATPEEFQEWLTATRKVVEDLMREIEGSGDDDGQWVIDEQPADGEFDAEWMYELDLDNLVFHIDSFPVFRLDHPPPADLFVELIGFDHYGHRASTENTPEEYRYNWSAPPPPPTHLASTVYRDRVQQPGPALVHDLLSVGESLSDIERCRVALLEKLVGHHMTFNRTGYYLHILENIPSRDQIPEELFYFVLFALHPMIFPYEHELADDNDRLGFMWLTSNLCVRMATHLDDEATLQDSVGELISHVTISTESKAYKGVVYGVLFSIFHCVIVSIDLSAGGQCRHTAALPFLPSWYAYTPSTPGITALARLGTLLNFKMEPIRDVHSVKIILSGSDTVHQVNKPSMFSRIPEDICHMIVLYLHDPVDILTFGSLSPACKAAAMWILRYPHVDGYRLLKPTPQPLEIMVSSNYPATHFALLHSGGFEASAKSGDVVMELGSLDEPRYQMQHSDYVRFPWLEGAGVWYGVRKESSM